MPCLQVLQLILWLCPWVFKWLVIYAALRSLPQILQDTFPSWRTMCVRSLSLVAKAAVHVCMEGKRRLKADQVLLFTYIKKLTKVLKPHKAVHLNLMGFSLKPLQACAGKAHQFFSTMKIPITHIPTNTVAPTGIMAAKSERGSKHTNWARSTS